MYHASNLQAISWSSATSLHQGQAALTQNDYDDEFLASLGTHAPRGRAVLACVRLE